MTEEKEKFTSRKSFTFDQKTITALEKIMIARKIFNASQAVREAIFEYARYVVCDKSDNTKSN